MIRTHSFSAVVLTVLLSGSSTLFAQSNPAKPDSNVSGAKQAQEPAPSKTCPDCAARRKDVDATQTRTFYLKYTTSANEMNEITSALRQLLPPYDTALLVPGQGAILIRAIPEDFALAQKVLDNLDRPKKSWRLTYTLTEMDGNSRLGTQHYSMVVAAGQETTLKQGDRVPVATGAYSKPADSTNQTVFNYQDVGMSFDATLNEIYEGARLRSDIAQTSLADDKPAAAAQDPVFRQTTLRSEAVLAPGKPLILGSMDMPGSTHHLQIEVLMEPLP